MSFTKEEIRKDIENKFAYHKPTEDQVIRYDGLRNAFRSLAFLIVDTTPVCPDQTVALRKLHDANMAVNLVIACNEPPE